MTDSDPVAVARASYKTYETKDKAALEKLVAPDFKFTSPVDNHIDRATYFARCWLNSQNLEKFDLIHTVLCLQPQGDKVFVVYEATNKDGKRFRNCELLTILDGQLKAVEVYFGWNLPHPAAPGEFVQDTAGKTV